MTHQRLHNSFGMYTGSGIDSSLGDSLADRLRKHGDIPPEALAFTDLMADINHFSSVYRVPPTTRHGLARYPSSPIVAHGSPNHCDSLFSGDRVLCLFRASWGRTVMEVVSFHGYGECLLLDHTSGE